MIFKGFEILIAGVVAILKMILISFEMYNFNIILGGFTTKVVFQKPRYPELEFDGDRRILPTCVISALKAKRLLHKGCEAYLADVVDKFSSAVTLDSVVVVREFLDVFCEDLPSLPPD